MNRNKVLAVAGATMVVMCYLQHSSMFGCQRALVAARQLQQSSLLVLNTWPRNIVLQVILQLASRSRPSQLQDYVLFCSHVDVITLEEAQARM